MQKINNKICGSGAAIVGYIYNELSLPERDRFEEHLLDCTACTDEFAAIADSRYAVYEWQKLEFEPMETPRFVIPYAETKVSWFDVIKGMFATGPRLAAAGAFGLFIAAFGFAAIMMSGGPTEVVSIDSIKVNETFTEPAAAPAVENTAVRPVEPDLADKDKIKPELASVNEPKIRQKRKAEAVRRNTARPQVLRTETQAKAPRLNDFEDLSDDSLRLSDLVADVDTKD